MDNAVDQLKRNFEDFLAEDAKFSAGNNAAGTRARKAPPTSASNLDQTSPSLDLEPPKLIKNC